MDACACAVGWSCCVSMARLRPAAGSGSGRRDVASVSVTTGGRRPQSWTHRFAVRDRAAAQVLADAMAAAGFGEVGACPTPKQHLASLGMGWEVIVVDDGPYPRGMAGLRQADAVERRARAIARAHGGFWCGGSTGPKYGSLERSGPQIL